MTSTSTLVVRGVAVFDSEAGVVTPPQDVTVRDGLVARVVPAGTDDVPPGTPTIDGTGRTLLPGLIDAHWHASFATVPLLVALTADVGYVFAAAVVSARDTLLRGFTTVRDLGGPSFGLKRAIDEGVVPGPRIYPSGAFISQTGGHGDFRLPYETPRGVVGHLSRGEIIGAAAIADGPAEVLRAAREQLMHGASQLKLMAGGGVASSYDPLDVSQYTFAELRAAVEAAENHGTYVTVHAYTPHAVRTAVEAGVRCIEHGQLLDEPTIALLAERGVRLCLQPFLDDDDAPPLSRSSTGWTSRSAPTCCSSPRSRAARARCSPSSPGGTRRPRCSSSRRSATPSCSRCPASATRTRAASASSRRARSPTSCWSTATPSPTCRSWGVPTRRSSRS